MDYTQAMSREGELIRKRQYFRTDFSRVPILAANENLMSALTIGAGTPSVATVDVTGAFDQTILNNNFATVATQINNARLSLIARTNMDPAITLAGTSAASGSIANYAKGGMLVTTHTVQNTQMLFGPATGRVLAAGYLAQRRPHYICVFETQASIAELTFKMGLTLTGALDEGTDANQAYFRYNSSEDGLLDCGISVANTDTIRSTGITLAANTLYVVEIDVDENRVPHFYVSVGAEDRREVGKSGAGSGNFGALTNAISLFPNFGLQTLADPGAKSMAFLDQNVGLYTP